MKNIASLLLDLQKERDPYKLGYDCGLHGANQVNCHFSIFSTRERTKEWERGKQAAATQIQKVVTG